jgi:hypothetical protein
MAGAVAGLPALPDLPGKSVCYLLICRTGHTNPDSAARLSVLDLLCCAVTCTRACMCCCSCSCSCCCCLTCHLAIKLEHALAGRIGIGLTTCLKQTCVWVLVASGCTVKAVVFGPCMLCLNGAAVITLYPGCTPVCAGRVCVLN